MPAYTKPSCTSSDLINILRQRGLIITDSDRVSRYLEAIGYLRLKAYFIPFYASKKCFKQNTTFDDILQLYIFDRKLRLLALDPVQRIEAAVRATISNHMCLRYDPFWMLNAKLFRNQDDYNEFLSIALSKAGKNCKYLSHNCKEYHTNYGDHALPPSWITIEELSMGTWSKLFSNLKDSKDKATIASKFGIHKNDFKGWIQRVTIIRNALSHLNRFWNAQFPFTPSGLQIYAKDSGPINGAYSNFVIIYRLLKCIVTHSSWPDKLEEYLYNNSPFDYHICMKFPVGWRQMPFWQ